MKIEHEILKHLSELKESLPELAASHFSHPYSPGVGICSNVLDNACVDMTDEEYDEAAQMFEDAIHAWPGVHPSEHRLIYPVEGEAEYYKSAEEETLYQNPRRLALLDFLITYFTEKCNE